MTLQGRMHRSGTRVVWVRGIRKQHGRRGCVCVSASSSTQTSGRLPSSALHVSAVNAIEEIGQAEWDACNDASNRHPNPFLTFDFLDSLEQSGSAVGREGWWPRHIVARRGNQVVGVAPAYIKTHSFGEFVFDQSFSSAFRRAGESYYPKLQCCVPFSPCTGPRLLVRPGEDEHAVKHALAHGLQQYVDDRDMSSAHITFPLEQEAERLQNESASWLVRQGVQYHWVNRNYQSFNDFEQALRQKKRKSIRQERKRPLREGLRIKRITGDDITPRAMDEFYGFYVDTAMRKFGMPYLTREFFHHIRERMADQVLLVMAEDEIGTPVGGAINLIGGSTIFGRNWGCKGFHDCLHFEVCYYQAIEAAIEWGLDRVEAGAQGEHKIQRGYEPTFTYSLHYIRDEQFRSAIGTFLEREKTQMSAVRDLLLQETPYKEEHRPDMPGSSPLLSILA